MKDKYYTTVESKEIKKERQIALIIHKLKKGIPLTSTEFKFLKESSPVYYSEALKQGNIYRKRKTDLRIGKSENKKGDAF